jgi:hypothetical protein
VKTPLRPSHWLNIWFVGLAAVAYLVLTFLAPHRSNTNPYHLSIAVILLLTVTIIGLWLATCLFGLLAWLRLSVYAHTLPSGANRRAYERLAQGVRILAYGLLVSSIISATNPYFAHDPGAAAIVTQLNNLLILIAPFVGFLYLRLGSRSLAVSAHAVMSLRAKLVTVGPPVLVLASFYVFLAATNASPSSQLAASGPVGFLMLPLNIVLVVGSWTLGLLAALNIERATHRGTSESQARPLVKLYNGMLTMTGGFIILDALESLGTTRLASLPLSIVVFLLYAFIAVVGLGFMQVWISARAHLVAAKSSE